MRYRKIIALSAGMFIFGMLGPADHAEAQANDGQLKDTSPFGTSTELLAYKSVPRETYRNPDSTWEALALWRQFHLDFGYINRKDSQVVRDSYIDILRRWGKAPGVGEVELLAELEHRLYDNERCYHPDQVEVLDFLSGFHSGSILPLTLLHVQTWQHALDHGRYSRLEANGRRIEQFIRMHAASLEGSERATRESATLLTYFAELIWEAGYVDLFETGISALDTALDLHKQHVAARYLRAMMYEKVGFYRKALRDLDMLGRMMPDQGDITLRRAVQLTRRGKDRDAEALLDGLIARRDLEPWIRIVAYQERVRSSIRSGNLKAAESLLQQAQGQFPDNFRLALMDIELGRQSTHKADPRSRSRLDHWHQDAGPTPRLRYLQGPLPELDDNRLQLDRDLKSNLDALAKGALSASLYGFGGSPRCSGLWKRLRPSEEDRAKIARFSGTETSGEKPSPGQATPIKASELAATADSRPAITTAATGGISPRATPAVARNASKVYIDETTGQKIRVDETLDLSLQQIYVTPSRFGRKGHGLDASKLTVFDQGRRQDIVTFEQGDVPFTATLVMDASGSMEGSRLRHALDGAQAFIGQMESLDQARLLIAADRIQGVSAFVKTDDASNHGLVDRLPGTAAEGGTALFDHLFLAVDALEPELGRKVVIVLSDGFDLMSVVPVESIRGAVQRSQTQVYWVRLRDNPRAQFTPPTGWRPVGETRQQLALMERMVRESGGEVVDITRPEQVTEAFTTILDQLRSQVAIGYYADPAHGDGRWREVKVKADGLGVSLRHASGYFDD